MDQPLHDADPVHEMKARAAELRSTAAAAGRTLKHGAALEAVAHERGFRDWNSAVASAKTRPTRYPPKENSAFLWRDLAQPLPVLPIRLRRASSSLFDSIRALMRWADQVELIAESMPEENRAKLLGSMGGDLPYVFVQDRDRWDDDLYRLCDRGYDPWKGIAFNGHELAAAGVIEWEDEYGNHGGNDMFSVAWDEPMASRNSDTLKRLARLVAGIALVAYEAHERQMGERMPQGRSFTVDLNDPRQLTAGHVARLLGSRDDSVHREVRVTKTGVAYLSDVVGNAKTDDLAFGLGIWTAGADFVGLAASRDHRHVQQVLDDLVKNWPTPTDDVNDWT